MRMHEVTMGRFKDQLVKEKFVRLAGYPVGCRHPTFRSKYFYTPTSRPPETAGNHSVLRSVGLCIDGRPDARVLLPGPQRITAQWGCGVGRED